MIISGTFWTGSSFKILKLVDKDEIIMVDTKPILQEYNKIINSEEILEKTTIYQQVRIQVLNKILKKARIVKPKEKIDIIKEDIKYNMFLEAAKEGNASFIINQFN